MKITLIAVGKTTEKYFVDAIDEYRNRLKFYLPFEFEIIPELKNTKSLSELQQKEKEGELILKQLQPGDVLVLLDEHGKEFTSMKFADYIEKKTHSVSKRLVFVIDHVVNYLGVRHVQFDGHAVKQCDIACFGVGARGLGSLVERAVSVFGDEIVQPFPVVTDSCPIQSKWLRMEANR